MMKRSTAVVVLALTACPGPPSDVKLDPPAAGSGFQLAPAMFEVPMGSESQRCFFFEVPSDVPVFVSRFEIAQNPGTHHMNVFRVRTVKLLGGTNGQVVAEGECWKPGNWSDWPLVVNSQLSDPNAHGDLPPGHTRWDMPTDVAMRFEPHELLMLQSHYVNATTQKTPQEAKVLVNFHTIPAAQVKAEVGTAFATNQSIRVCPGDTDKFFETTCKLSSDADGGTATPITIIGANSHFHSRGTKFTISVMDPGSSASPPPFYTSTDWHDPPMEWALNVPVPAGGGFRYRCEYAVPASDCGNPDDSCCYAFGGKVETQEHCNAFVYFYPKTRDVGCF